VATHSGAKFKIEASTSVDGGYDASASAVLSLQLEASPALDVTSCVYSVPLRSSGASAPTLSSSGVASPPTSIITLTIGAGSHSYLIKCMTNDGAAVPGPDGKPDFTVNAHYRIVSVRTTSAGLRKIIVGETLQYDPSQGWVDAFNDLVDAVETLALASGTVDLSTGLHFAASDTFLIDWAAPAMGVTPGAAVISGQNAPTGDAVDGGKVTIKGGARGDAEHQSGEIEIDLGNEDDNDIVSAPLVIKVNGAAGLTIQSNGGAIYLNTTGSIPLVVRSPTGSASLTTDTAGFTADTTRAVIIAPVLTLGSMPVERAPTSVSISGGLALDLSGAGHGAKIELTVSAASTLANPTNVLKGARYQIKTLNPSGAATLAWGANWKFGATSSAITASANAIDIFEFEGDSGGICRLISASKGVHA
jgi:hypothetical protein